MMTLLEQVQNLLDEGSSEHEVVDQTATQLESGTLSLSGNFRGCEATENWREMLWVVVV